MKLAISRISLSSPNDLLLDEGFIRWGQAAADHWIIGNSIAPRSLEALCEVAGVPSPTVIPQEFLASMDGLTRGPVPWPLIVPQRVLGEHIREMGSILEDAIDRVGDYSETLVSSRRILSLLQPARIDLAALRVEQGRSTTSILDSFEPAPDFLCPVPSYSHATATGRLTVQQGPRILTLQKEHRRILSSRFPGGRMMQVDFVSLEPRVLRLLSKGFAPVDIYSDVSERLGGAASRRQVKLATLKLLYGSSRAGLEEEVGAVGSKVIRGIEDYFGLRDLKSRLSSQLARDGEINNFWGRRLPEATEQHLLVSHYTQSTAVDIALGCFGDLVERITAEDLDVIPCYVLHDALLIDVHPDSEMRLSEIISEGFGVDGIGHFEVSLTPAYLEQQ